MPWNYDDEEINGIVDANLKDSPPNPPAVNTAASVREMLKSFWSAIRGQVSSAIDYADDQVGIANDNVDEALASVSSQIAQTVTSVEQRVVTAEQKTDSIYEQFSLADGIGTFNPLTGIANEREPNVSYSPTINADKSKGKYFDLIEDGTTAIIDGTQKPVKKGGKIISRGTKWDYIPPADTGYAKATALELKLQSVDTASGYVAVLTDADDNILFYINLKGEFAASSYLANSISGTALKSSSIPLAALSEEIKGLVLRTMDVSSGWIGAWVDSEDNILIGIKPNGKVYIHEIELSAGSVSALLAGAVFSGAQVTSGTISIDKLDAPLLSKINNSNPTTAVMALAQAAVRRVDIVMLGDSNQKFGGDGWDAGLLWALSQRYQQYASPLYGVRNSISYEGGSGTTGFGTSHSVVDTNDAMPPEFLPFVGPAGKNGAYNAEGDFNSNGGAIMVSSDSPLGVNNALRAHFKCVKFPGGGTFQPGWRRGSSPYNTLVAGTPFNFSAAQIEEGFHTVDLPAGSRDHALELKYRWSAASVGPNMLLTSRIENPSRLAGFSITNLYAAGGQSLWDMAEYLRTQTLLSLANFFKELRRLQVQAGQKPIVEIYINSAINDQNENMSPSQGWRADTVPSSAASYLDNLEYIRNRLIDAYEYHGFDAAELYFLIMPSHPISDPDGVKVASYRKAAKSFCQYPRCSMVDLSLLTTAAEIAANGWLSEGTDVNHLVLPGNKALALRALNKYVPVI